MPMQWNNTRQDSTLFEEGLDIDAISRRTGAVSGCSGCEWDIIEMLKCLSDHQGASLDQK